MTRAQSEGGRCHWALPSQAGMVEYHDREWGVPVRDDRTQFEFLVLESAQAGLSWYTILRKRDGYRAAFADFDPERVARYTPARIERLLTNSAIVRNRAKIEAAIGNAKCFLAMQREYGSFSEWLWGFVDGRPVVNHWREPREVPATTPLSDTIAKELKQRGFRFLGSTVVYAHLQATGIVNDHLIGCFRHAALSH
ncbi:MAG: DNA-3-methyladenine glycosylase I [Gammaproteobacteria bacterium]|nr:DNA-3-methyladenine glycosylase I [Gammaproteobacteria bacterium]